MNFKTAHTIGEKERTKDIEIKENITFEEMFLSDAVLSGLHACGFVRPSPIQLSAIPLGRCGLDLIVQAKSGTGKTCVFSVIALEMISVLAKTTQVLVIAPTREIAVQICQVINSIGSSMPSLKASTFIGGTNVLDDKAKLKCCHIAIGTPGRLTQMVSLGHLSLKNVRLLVMDEADQLLTGQFKDAIQELVKTLPLNKQVLAMSATYPPQVTEFLDKYMRTPSHVRLGKESPALLGVHQFVKIFPYHPQPHQRHKGKFEELLYILSTVPFNQCLVFSNSQLRAESICNQLKSSGWPASYLTGGQVQADRLEAFFALCSYKCRILVSTDLSARGLDSEHVNLVINLEIPNDQATYLHRVGRAGRFGSKGTAISLVCKGEEFEGMKAVTTLSNLVVKILPPDYDSNMFSSDVDLELVEHLSDESCALWLEKENYRRQKYREVAKNKVNGEDKTRKSKKDVCDIEGPKFPLLSNTETLVCNKKSKREIKKKENSTQEMKELTIKALKNLLTFQSHINDFKPHAFTFEGVSDFVCTNWDFISKQEEPKLIKSTIAKQNPSKSDFASLELYMNTRGKETGQQMNRKLVKTSLEALQDIIQGVESQNHSEIGQHDRAYDQDEINIQKEDLCAPQKDIKFSKANEVSIPSMDSKRQNTDVNSQTKVNGHKNESDASCNSLKGNCKEDLIAERKKKYLENTGFGQWEKVEPKDKTLRKDHTNSNQDINASPLTDGHLSGGKTKHTQGKYKEDRNGYQENHFYPSYYSNNNVVKANYPMPMANCNYPVWDQYYLSTEAYIRSAQKFGMMMEYVRTMGKMSAQIALDHNRKYFENLY